MARKPTLPRHCLIGASFIVPEVAASLRSDNVQVPVVVRETCPMEKILCAEVGSFVRKFHDEHGVIFHRGTAARMIDNRRATSRVGRTG